ncbi:MAG: hypothetical protein ABIK43_04060 [candidate division WOR-3 bacterium]
MRLMVLVLVVPVILLAVPSALDTLHNVGVAEIIYPRGTVDSGVPVVPRVLVKNYGRSDESLSVVVMFEDGWMETVTIPSLGAGSQDTVEFPQWVPSWVDSISLWSWTECPRDSFAEDDTSWVRFLVGVFQVGMEPGGTPDTLESASVYRPSRWVYNRGNVSVQFDLVFGIVGELRSAVHGSLSPGERREFLAPDSWIARPGIWRVLDSLIVLSDSYVIALEDTIVVTGPVLHDLAVTRIIEPAGQVDTVRMLIPCAEITNRGPKPETCAVRFLVTGPARETIYVDSVPSVVVERIRTVTFRPNRFRQLGPHEAICSLYCRRDQEPMNNVFRQPFEVVPERRPDIRLLYAGAERDTVDTLTPVQPIARLRNLGNALDSGRVWMFISDPYLDTLAYADSINFMLGPGQEERYPFRPEIFRIPGTYSGFCRFRASQGSEDSTTWRLVVVSGAGIAEAGNVYLVSVSVASIVADITRLSGCGRLTSGCRLELVDGSGRVVLRLDKLAGVTRVEPGVYFVRTVGSVERKILKVIVTGE